MWCWQVGGLDALLCVLEECTPHMKLQLVSCLAQLMESDALREAVLEWRYTPLHTPYTPYTHPTHTSPPPNTHPTHTLHIPHTHPAQPLHTPYTHPAHTLNPKPYLNPT